MQIGFAASYLPSDPRSSNATRFLRRDEGTNARGQVLSSRFGSGDSSQAYQWLVSEYDASTGWLLSRCSGITICSGVAQSGTALDTSATMKLGYEYDVFGNVSKSVNVGKRPAGVTDDVRLETFSYDALHRMLSAKRDGAVPIVPMVAVVNYSYSPVGNLQSKSDFGSNYNYGSAAPKHGVKSVLLNSMQTQNYAYDANGNVKSRYIGTKGTPETFGYDIDNRPQWTKTVSSTGVETRIDFYLSASGAKAVQISAGPNPRVVIYAGSYEAEYSGTELTASRTYLAEGVLHNGAGLQQGLSFMHQDRLGSALVITDKGGAILNYDGTQAEFRSFDAFGKARDNRGLDSWAGRLFAGDANGKRNRKGFTGHEHLDEAGLIHMNGRTYDYNLGRFYGVDPVIQFPTNSQSLNGYSYLMNNPLAGTDPTGYAECDVSAKVSCLTEGSNTIVDGDKKLGAINVTSQDSGKSYGLSLNDAGRAYVTSRSLANGGSNLQGSAGAQDRKSSDAAAIGGTKSRENDTVGDAVYENRGIHAVGMDSEGRNLGRETAKSLLVMLPCSASGPAAAACAVMGSAVLAKSDQNPEAGKVGMDMMAPGFGAILERAVVAIVGKVAASIGRAAVQSAERIKVGSPPIPDAVQAPVSTQQLKYHYTSSPDSAFADGFRAGSSVTDRANLLPYEAHQTLGIPIPTRVIPIIDRGTFGPASEVLATDKFFGGGTQYFNPNRIPPGDILPGFDFPK